MPDQNAIESDSPFAPERLAQLISEAICDGMLVIDKEFRIRYVNDRFAEIYGKKPADFIGRNCTEVVGFDHCARSCPHHNLITEGAEFSDHNLYCQKCSAGPFCISATPLRDESGEVVGVVELFRNMKGLGMYVGSLEDANTVLFAEKQRLHHILDSIADGYYYSSPDGKIISANEKLLKLLGKTAPEVVGRDGCDVMCDDSCKVDSPLRWAIEHGENVIGAHQKLNIRGQSLPFEKSILLMKDESGKIESIVGVINRISEAITLDKSADLAIEYHEILTKNREMKATLELIREAAPTDAPVLITGETGSGKELVANAIQRLSHRSDKPYVRINCSALTESLLESELFGHVRGAFTGAVAGYAGKFKAADKGTIFLDEVEEMSPGLQAKLLRVIEAQEFEPVGSNRLERVDVRIITATNLDLTKRIAEGLFRSDLYYRLNVIRIDVPPLRRRREDIPVLIKNYLVKLQQKYHKEINTVSTRALNVLVSYDWPGNVRQLFGALEYAFLRAGGMRIERKDLPREIYDSHLATSFSLENADEERNRIEELLKLYPNNRKRVAFELGVSRTTLWRRMQDLGL